MKHPIDELFRDHLGKRNFPVLEEDWLAAKRILVSEQSRRKRFVWLWTGLSLTALVALTGIFLPVNWSEIWNVQPDAPIVDQLQSRDVASSNAELLPPDKISNHHPDESRSPMDVHTGGNTDRSAPSSNPSAVEDAISYPVDTDIRPSPTADESLEIRQLTQPIEQSGQGEIRDKVIAVIPGESVHNDDVNSQQSIAGSNIQNEKEVLDVPTDNRSQIGEIADVIKARDDNSSFVKKSSTISRLAIAELSGHADLLPMSPKESKIVMRTDRNPLPKLGIGGYGSAFLYPFQGSTMKSWRGFSAGLDAKIKVLGRIYGYLGLGLRYQNGTFGVDQTADFISRSGAFNSNREILEITPKAVYYLHLPVGIGANFGRHSVAAIADVNPILYVRGRQLSQTFDQQAIAGVGLDAATAEMVTESDIWQSKESFNPVHWQLGLSYSYKLNRWISVGTGFSWMINDMQTSDLQIQETNKLLLQFTSRIHLWEM